MKMVALWHLGCRRLPSWQDAPLSRGRSQKYYCYDSCRAVPRHHAATRQHSLHRDTSHWFTIDFLLASAQSLGIIFSKRSFPREDKDAIVARPRRTTAGKLRVVADAAREPAVSASSKPDQRLVNLVRLLARQAARDFVQAETDNRTRDRLPE